MDVVRMAQRHAVEIGDLKPIRIQRIIAGLLHSLA